MGLFCSSIGWLFYGSKIFFEGDIFRMIRTFSIDLSLNVFCVGIIFLNDELLG